MISLHPRDRILFQGDSITHAFRLPEEKSTSSQLGTGWVTLLAAQLQAEHPDWRLEILNRGECGHGVRELRERWQRDCLDLRPTVLNLLVGVNDTIGAMSWNRPCPVDLFRDTYAALLEETRSALPDLRIILCEPFLLETGDVTPAWREDLAPRRAAVRELAAEFDACFVPLQDAFDRAAADTGPDTWLFDGIHPHAAGQWLIRNQWRAKVPGASDRIPRMFPASTESTPAAPKPSQAGRWSSSAPLPL